jgi:UDP-3-O-[3-hydroxymyristoyl] glucosamine N-acyltransferase
MKKFNIEDIKNVLDDNTIYLGNENNLFSNVKSVKDIDDNSLDWISSTMRNKEDYLSRTKASVIICEKGLEASPEVLNSKLLILVDNPKISFSKLVTDLFKVKEDIKIHPTAQILKGAKIGRNVFIGPNTVIYGNVEVQSNSIIGANNTIGADGFGYEKDPKTSELFKFPHLGKVIIGKNVEIGNNTCIDRGALSDTIIGEGTKIDNLVHIAHNVVIGRNCCIIANSMIAGSTSIGDNTWIAPNAALREHISIGKNVLIGLGAIVTKPVADNEIIAGFPAIPFKKMITIFKSLLKGTE